MGTFRCRLSVSIDLRPFYEKWFFLVEWEVLEGTAEL
jgi:hypothetical protein